MKILISKDLNIDNKKRQFLGEFCAYCAKKLPIKGDFKVYVVSDRDKHNIATTAMYEVGNSTCRVYGKDRALPDIMRSIAHELTHMMQDQQGLLIGKIQDAGGYHEDQANARAGELIKRFAKSSDERRGIYEASKIYESLL